MRACPCAAQLNTVHGSSQGSVPGVEKSEGWEKIKQCAEVRTFVAWHMPQCSAG